MGVITRGVLKYAKWDFPPDDSRLRKLKQDFTKTKFLFDKFKREVDYGSEDFEYAHCSIEEGKEGMEKQNLGMLIAVLESMTQQLAVALTLLDSYSELDVKNHNNYQQAIDTQNLQKKELEERIERVVRDLERLVNQEVGKLSERMFQLNEKIDALGTRISTTEQEQGKLVRFKTQTEARIAAIAGISGTLFAAISLWINWVS